MQEWLCGVNLDLNGASLEVKLSFMYITTMHVHVYALKIFMYILIN